MKTTPISENLKKILDDRGLKQKYLAQKMNISEGVVSNMVNNRKTFDEELIIGVAEALDVDFNTIFGYEKV